MQEEPQEHRHNTTFTQHAQNGKENPNAAKQAQQEEPPVSTRCSSKQRRNQWHGTSTHPPQSKYPFHSKHPCVHKARWQTTTKTRTQHTPVFTERSC